MNESSLPRELQGRELQMFPTLDPTQIALARRFGGAPRRFGAGKELWAIGTRDRVMYLVIEGSIDVMRPDPKGDWHGVTTHRPGQISGDVSAITGRAAIVRGTAGAEGAVVAPFEPSAIRALIIGSVELGELLMRAFILRLVHLVQGTSGSVVLGHPATANVTRIANFFARNGYPYTVLDPATDADAAAMIERFAVEESELPILVCSDGTLLRNPSDVEVARCVGMVPELEDGKVYDVAVVGAGPAGLATAVYAASEGLSVLVLDSRSVGGQAGASARIENYLGFPTGISGRALMSRAFSQASKFGALVVAPLGVTGLRRRNGPIELALGDGQCALARTAVIASGARYRRPTIDRLDELEGHGVYYWASPVEARLCCKQEVALIGGGNSAGQAVVYLAGQAERVHLLVRRSLDATMSRYLIDRIKALPNVEIHQGAAVTALEGNAVEGLTGVSWRNADRQIVNTGIRHLFSFIGADPNTDWLAAGDIALDDKGFVPTGGRPSLSLETSVAGIFAIGDVRAGSTKRVAAAVGEGAAVVAQIHSVLSAVTD